MTSEGDVFHLSGPTHLIHVNWKDPNHRRSVAACLVQGVYVLERDRQQNRAGSAALAPPWWEFFHFQVIRKLQDDADSSVFGVIYEFKPHGQRHQVQEAPRFVIAFRGTITKPDTISRDLDLNVRFIWNNLHQSSRFQTGMQAVQCILSAVGNLNTWLAGHSLGSAIATLVGKNLAKMGMFLDTFLFNPPFVSAPIGRIKDKKLKHGIRIAGSLITAGLAVAVNGHCQKPIFDKTFSLLSAWVPYLYVNPNDHICSEYIGYFEHREKMETIGVGWIERLATQNSVGDLVLTAFGRESEPLHLIPSACLMVNLSPTSEFKQAHGLLQWWGKNMNMQCKRYDYKL